MICWDGGDEPLTCDGLPEPTLTYLAEDALFRLLGWTACPQDDDPAALCANYNRPPFVVRYVLPWAPHVCAPLPDDPPLGSVWLVRISSYNAAGVRDDAPCP